MIEYKYSRHDEKEMGKQLYALILNNKQYKLILWSRPTWVGQQW